MVARRHGNGDLRPAPRPGGPRTRVPPNRVETGERRSPTGIARQRETSAGLRPASRESAKPASITPRHTNVRTAPPLSPEAHDRSLPPLPGPCLSTGTAARRAAKRASPIVRKRGDGLERRPLVGTAGRSPANRASPDYCDMFGPSRPRYCDMFRSSRSRYCDMFPRQIRLLRHVRPQPIPLLRHVPPAETAIATCSPNRSR